MCVRYDFSRGSLIRHRQTKEMIPDVEVTSGAWVTQRYHQKAPSMGDSSKPVPL